MRLQPIGVPGELYIGGNQVGRGYLGREELTTEKFIPNPFLHGDRLYRTGDIAKWLPDGNIAFLGRKDHQVKIRGFRVEPEEIETHLMDIDFVKEAVVLARGGVSGEKYLCAYIVSHRLFEGHELRHALAAKLPDYMIPSYFVPMDNIPLTPSKKVDKNALPEPRSEGRSTTRAAPGDEIEKKLALFWEDILKARNIGIDDDFFDLGGHSLKANILKARVSKEFNVEFPLSKIFSHSTVRRFADYVKTLKSSVYEDIKPVEKQTHYPLSSAQKRLYILSRMEKPNVVYNLAGIRGIEGELDKSRIEKAFHGVLRRHESLRTSFALKGGEAAQIIHENVNFEIEDIKIPHPQNREETVAAAERFVRPFNLGEPPLIRIGIARIEEKKHLLFFDMHHIISDGVSMAVLTRDLIYLYEGKELPTLPVQYKDFSQWQNALLESEAIGKQRRYWLDLFKDGIPALKMMTDNPRPPVQCLEGDNIIFHLDNELTSRLNRLAKETGTTLYMVLLSIYNVLFFRYTGQEDIVVGLPIAGRNHTDLENIIGFFVNTLAMRNYPMGDKSFEQFLEEVKGNALDAYENQDYPFDELVNKLNIPKDLSRNPIFDVMFVLQNMERMQEFEHLKMSTYDYIPGISHFDLHLHAVEDNGMLRMTLEYSTALFNRSTVKNITNHYIEISRQVVEDKETRLEDFEISQDFLIPEPTLLEEDVDDFGF